MGEAREQAIDRMIDVFPSDQQAQVRTLIAESLRGIVAQQLLRRRECGGRVPAVEILFGSHAVSNIIREGKIEKIVSVIQSGKREGMQSMDDALDVLLQAEQISGLDAYMKATDKSRFASAV